MKYIFALAAALTSLVVLAAAHSEKESTTPANGAIVAAVPESVELRFNDGMRFTKVEMTHAGFGAPSSWMTSRA